MKDERIAIVEEPAGVESLWRILSTGDTPPPKVWMDAYLAAFAISNTMQLVTLDQGFARFESQGLDLLLLNS